ncbi:MAG: glycosyltransferase family 2 protein [Candidatus Omnitrophota bacterium]
MKVNIAILNYNGINLLKECLPSIIAARRVSKQECAVTVLDNQSTDASVNFLKDNFSEIGIYIAKENKVLCSFNEFASKSDADILILLNNDIKVDEHFVDPLADIFQKHSDAFLVGPKCLMFDNKTYDGSRSLWWIDKGIFKASSRYKGFEKDIDIEGYTMQSGFGAFDRKKFLELGGYDDLYLPGIMEDADLCYRAWKAGHKSYYQPKSLVFHMGQASFKKEFGSRKIMELAHRNTFLFMWKNIRDVRVWASHFFWLPLRIFYSVLTNKREFVTGFMKALPKFKQAFQKGNISTKYLLNDQELFKISKNI